MRTIKQTRFADEQTLIANLTSTRAMLEINREGLSLPALRQVWEAPVKIGLGDVSRSDVSHSHQFVEHFLSHSRTAYGINTGFGKLATIGIDESKLSLLQENLVRSHAAGVGKALPDEIVRLAIVLKAFALAKGYSGVRPLLIEGLCSLVNNDMYPIVPAKGSVGASGDLAPLAHIAGTLIGEGKVSHNGVIMRALDALVQVGLEPMKLAPKEGLALLNGTQISTALGLAAVFRTERIVSAALVAGAMSTDAVKACDTPFDSRIHLVRGHLNQQAVGQVLHILMQGSEIRESHLDCTHVQDPYSIRCQPQVLGACFDALRHVATVLSIEANAVTDNPLIFADDDVILSGGNFHAEPVAMVADYLALAIAEIGSMSERRIALLVDSNASGLPAFLVDDIGLNSGFMLPQVTAAALASENKSLAHPASVDSIPTSANQEDHVSMATFAARRLHDMLDNVEHIVAIELLAATQGIEFHRPLRSSEPIELTMERIRSISPRYERDRSLSNDMEAVAQLIRAGDFCDDAQSLLPSFAS